MKYKLKKCITTILSMLLTCSLGMSSLVNVVANNTALKGELTLDKTSTYNAKDDTYTINLSAYAKGIMEVVQEGLPLDIVLVLDQSGSMDNYMNGRTKKIDALRTAVSNFVDQVKQNNANHRIAIVGFGDEDNTEILNGKNKIGYNQLINNSNLYKNAYKSVGNTSDSKDLEKAIKSLSPKGATRSDLALSLADGIIKNNVSDASRKKVVIMFTDGVPTTYNTYNNNVAAAAVQQAAKLKGSGATVYTVGVSSDLDNKIDPTFQNGYISDVKFWMNRYMQYVSSNYPNSKVVDNYLWVAGEGGNYKNGKYLHTESADELSDIFSVISKEIITTSTTLDEKTVLKDVVSDYFNVSNGIKDIKLYTQKYKGKDGNGNLIWGDLIQFDGTLDYNQDSETVNVSGFNYKEQAIIDNPDGTTRSGSRLVVQIKVKAKEGFIGGNNVLTNKPNSGIYYEKEEVQAFKQPEVNVALNYIATANDSKVYQMQGITNAESIIDADDKMDGIQYKYKKDDKEKITTIDGVNNALVDITYTFTDTNGNVVGKAVIKAGETKLTWEQPISNLYKNTEDLKVNTLVMPSEEAHTNEGVATKIEGDNNAKVYVFKPITNVSNDVVFLDESVNLNDMIGETTWVCQENNKLHKPETKAPDVTYTYKTNDTIVANADEYTAKKDTIFKMNVSIHGEDVTTENSFVNKETVKDGTFKLSVIKGELQITKKVDKAYSENEDINANQTFIFRIDYTNEAGKSTTTYQSIDFDNKDFINGNAAKTINIKGLPKGTYKVSEETNWSWKYNFISSLTNYTPVNETKASKDTLNIGEKVNGTYFGVESGTTYNKEKLGNPGKITFVNVIKDKINTLGDTANAINKFKTK